MRIDIELAIYHKEGGRCKKYLFCVICCYTLEPYDVVHTEWKPQTKGGRVVTRSESKLRLVTTISRHYQATLETSSTRTYTAVACHSSFEIFISLRPGRESASAKADVPRHPPVTWLMYTVPGILDACAVSDDRDPSMVNDHVIFHLRDYTS